MKMAVNGRRQAVERTVSAVNDLIVPLGFELGTRDEFEWTRTRAWCFDVVDLVVERERTVMLPSFRVAIPGLDAYIAQANVGRLLSDRADYIPIPWFRPKIGRHVRRVVREIEAALPWFDQFATAAACKENLARFVKPGAPLYVETMEFLDAQRRN